MSNLENLTRQQLIDRIGELEEVIGSTARLPDLVASRSSFLIASRPPVRAIRIVISILLNREFVSRDALYTIMYSARPESDWPGQKIIDVRICQARKALAVHGIKFKTIWGKGWAMDAENKAKLRALVAQHSQRVAA